MSISSILMIFFPILLLGVVLYRLRPSKPWEQVANFPLTSGRKPGPGEAAARGLLEQLEDTRRFEEARRSRSS